MNSELKKYCKENGLFCRFRKHRSRYYVTIGRIGGIDDWKASYHKLSNGKIESWVTLYGMALEKFYPNAYMTSGSAESATYCIGELFEMLKS